MSERFDFTGDELAPAYRAAVDAIEAGDLVVLPTDTVYGIAADAFKADAVQRLLDAKGRGRDMPPPVLISVIESLDALATDVPEAGRKLCEAFWPGPLTVICHAQGSLMWDLGDTQGTVALRVPDHENTRELLSRTGPLAVSSANKSGQPAALDVYDAEAQLLESVAVFLDGGEVTGGQPSTIVDLTADVPHVVRIGALSMAQIREIVPEATTDLEPDEQTAAGEKPEETLDDAAKPEDKPAAEAPADEPNALDRPDADEKSDVDERPVDKPAAEASADEPDAAAKPDAEAKPADEPTEPVVEASNEQPPAAEKPAADKPDNEKPADVKPAAEKPMDEKTDARPAD